MAADDDEPSELVKGYARKNKLTHPILLKGGGAFELYDDSAAMPMAFWIDHRGIVVEREVGFQPQMEKEIARRIEEMLTARDQGATPAGQKEAGS